MLHEYVCFLIYPLTSLTVYTQRSIHCFSLGRGKIVLSFCTQSWLLGTDQISNFLPWTMSDMVKYRAALWSYLKLTALVFYHV